MRPVLPYLFYGTKQGRPILTRTFHKALTKVSDCLGFEPQVTPHHLRHAYASHQLDLGVDLRVLQLLLGHADPRTTAHYVTLSEGGLRRLRARSMRSRPAKAAGSGDTWAPNAQGAWINTMAVWPPSTIGHQFAVDFAIDEGLLAVGQFGLGQAHVYVKGGASDDISVEW